MGFPKLEIPSSALCGSQSRIDPRTRTINLCNINQVTHHFSLRT